MEITPKEIKQENFEVKEEIHHQINTYTEDLKQEIIKSENTEKQNLNKDSICKEQIHKYKEKTSDNSHKIELVNILTPIQCEVCCEEFWFETQLDTHRKKWHLMEFVPSTSTEKIPRIKTHSKKSLTTQNKKISKCPKCDKTFKSKIQQWFQIPFVNP